MIIRGERLGRKEKDFWETSRDKNSSNIPVSWPRQWRPRVAYPRNYIVVGENYRNARDGSSVLKVSSLDSSGREKKKRRKNKKDTKFASKCTSGWKFCTGKKLLLLSITIPRRALWFQVSIRYREIGFFSREKKGTNLIEPYYRNLQIKNLSNILVFSISFEFEERLIRCLISQTLQRYRRIEILESNWTRVESFGELSNLFWLPIWPITSSCFVQ